MNKSVDYVSMHLKWITDNPRFIPYGGVNAEIAPTYLKYMQWFYFENDMVTSDSERNEHGYYFLKSDISHERSTELALKRYLKDTNVMVPSSHFVTLNFDHATWSIPACIDVLNIIIGFEWVIYLRAVFELHRENGKIHPHMHLIIVTADKMAKSTLIFKLWAVGGIKKVMHGKNFIDCMPLEDRHHKYVLGIKDDKKMPFVKKDVVWRERNNIPDLFLKN